jgi:hypothetical protein
MKKTITALCLTLGLVSVASVVSVAKADLGTLQSSSNFTVYLDDNAYVYLNCQSGGFCPFAEASLNLGVWTILLPFNGTALSVGTSSGNLDREQYVGVLQEDAAQMIATDGAASALLKDAITRIRAQNPAAAGLDDKAVAEGILK